MVKENRNRAFACCRLIAPALCLAVSLVAGCASATPELADSTVGSKDYEVVGDLPGVARVVRLAEDAYRGAEPEGEEGMRSLRKLGIRTILSVDVSDEERTLAQRYGIAYHEVPLGYKGWSDEQAAEILRVLRTAEGPVYMHCHHGKHRAGSAAAIYRIGIQTWGNDRAERELAELGCSKRYVGIYESVRTWRPRDGGR